MAMEKTKNLMDKKKKKKKKNWKEKPAKNLSIHKSKKRKKKIEKKNPCHLTGSMPPTTQVVKAAKIDLEEEIGVQKSKIKNK